ncbi:cation diffusion facilitator family transporter [Pontibacter silvestris]|uniref:Cation diffusion facilitator family transporter n=1 Tax=Pontibacter silvestris TaxID=2305183 RepID=A0ABW4WVD1_9BACT|nr:cation diffusion facilitator family transporter [Pontibacter silvestris]MCC9136972.1 cation diffusion facilitator family transporter [Pontibacter silvestris]
MAASKVPLYTALLANLLIAVTKFIAAGITGSSAMISEGIHSLVDTSNEVLLLFGIKRSQKPADRNRPFGYGKELYFWAFIVSLLIFAVGGGISLYEGIMHIQHPVLIQNPIWNYIVLGVAIVFDGISLITAVREFNRQRGSTPFWSAVRISKDPSTFVVLFEDAADVLGLVVAFLGVFLGHQLQNPYLDGIASIIIGLILISISILLARESRSLLMGESADQKELDTIVALVEADPAAQKVLTPLSMYLAPEEIVLVLPVVFSRDYNQATTAESINRIRQNIQKQYPAYKQVFIEPELLTTLAHEG